MHIASPKSHPNNTLMVQGFKRAFKVNKQQYDEKRVIHSTFELEGAEIATEKAISMFGLPTAIFVANDYLAFGVLQYVRKNGLKIGKDVFLIGWDDIPFSEAIGLSSMKIDYDKIAKSTVYGLLNKIDPEIELPTIDIPEYKLVIRES